MSQPERDAGPPPTPSRWPGTEPLNDGPPPAPSSRAGGAAEAGPEPAPASGPSGAGGLKAVVLRRDLRIGLAVGLSLLILIGVLARRSQGRKAAGPGVAQTQSDPKIDPGTRASVPLAIHPHPLGQGAAGSNADEAKRKQAMMRDKLARRADAPLPPLEPTAAEGAKADGPPRAEGIDLSHRPPRPRTAEPEPWADPPTLALRTPPPPAPASSQVDLAPKTEPGPETSDIEKLFSQAPPPTPAAPTPPEAPAPQPTPDAEEPPATAKPPERETPRANPSAETTPPPSETPPTAPGSNPPSPPPSAPLPALSNGPRNEPAQSEVGPTDVAPTGTPEPRGNLAELGSGDHAAESSANPPASAPPSAPETDNPSPPATAPNPPELTPTPPSPTAPAAPASSASDLNPPPSALSEAPTAPINPPAAPGDLTRSAALQATPSGAVDGPSADGEWVRIPNAGKAALLLNDELDSTFSGALAPRATTARSAPSPAEDVIEPVRHVVQHGENFWTIARRYYGSGRYYKALWAANRAQVDAPEKLVVGMTIRIPPLEALDRALVVAPPRPSRTSAPPSRTRAAGEIPLMLPVRSPITEREATASGRIDDLDEDDAEARPPEPHYPTYRVRPRDTLRSIARDTLGDPRRAAEILEMNRDTIDDPHRLTVGQVLVLPEDARLGRRTR